MNKKRLLYAILIALLIIIVFILFGYFIRYRYTLNTETQYTNNTKEISAKDGNIYKVHNYTDAIDAANALAMINDTILKLNTYLKHKYIGVGYNLNGYSNTPPEMYTAVTKILQRYNPDNLVENSPKDKEDTSYTLNKGSTIAFCLREKGENNTLHDINTLIFVAIHELAHIAIDDNEHPPKFWKMFKLLLQEAEEGDIYTSQNYQKNPVSYCGMKINYNPLYDTKL
jgi:hypothetical protein